MNGTADDVVIVDQRGRSAGERLRLRRRALELSQWDVAERLGITQSAVSLAERGRVEARPLELALQELASRGGDREEVGGRARKRSVTRP